MVNEGSAKYFGSVIMEYADNGDLLKLMRQYQQQKKLIKENKIWAIFIQILQGLKALHDNNIIHRDLKVGFG